MSRTVKEINKAATGKDATRLFLLGRIDFLVTGKHLTGQNGKIVHRKNEAN